MFLTAVADKLRGTLATTGGKDPLPIKQALQWLRVLELGHRHVPPGAWQRAGTDAAACPAAILEGVAGQLADAKTLARLSLQERDDMSRRVRALLEVPAGASLPTVGGSGGAAATAGAAAVAGAAATAISP